MFPTRRPGAKALEKEALSELSRTNQEGVLQMILAALRLYIYEVLLITPDWMGDWIPNARAPQAKRVQTYASPPFPEAGPR